MTPSQRDELLRDARAAIGEADRACSGALIHDLLSSRHGVQMCVTAIEDAAERGEEAEIAQHLPRFVRELRVKIAGIRSGRQMVG